MEMIRTNSLDSLSTESDVFNVECSSEGDSVARNNTPAVLNSTELCGAYGREVITFSAVAAPELQFVTIESDSNKPTIPCGYGRQQRIILSPIPWT